MPHRDFDPSDLSEIKDSKRHSEAIPPADAILNPLVIFPGGSNKMRYHYLAIFRVLKKL